MSYKLTGKIVEIGEIIHVSQTFQKRKFVVETSEEIGEKTRNEQIELEFIQDKCDLLNKYSVNSSVEVNFNLNGRPWTNQSGKKMHFNTCQAWSIKLLGDEGEQAPVAPQMAPKAESPPVMNNAPTYQNENDEDIPF